MAILYEEFRPHAEYFASLIGSPTVIVTRYAELIERLAVDREEPLVVLGASVPLSEAVAVAEECRRSRPHVGVLLMRPHLEVSVMTEALRAGVREVLDAGDAAAIEAAVARSLALSARLSGGGPVELAETADRTTDGRIMTVFAAKGGCGKTTIATNLAIALAEAGRSVCLIDLDLAFGDVAIMLQLEPSKTIADAVPVADRIDLTGLRAMLTPYMPNVQALLAPVQPAMAEQVSRHLIAELIHLARSMFDDVIIDTPPQFNDSSLAALDAAHRYLLVTTPELPALKSLRITLDTFDMLDYRREDRVVILNRADSKVGLSPSDIDRIVRVPIAANVPSSRDVPLSINKGVPLVRDNPHHPVSNAIRALVAGRLGTAAPATAGRGGLRGMVSRRGKG